MNKYYSKIINIKIKWITMVDYDYSSWSWDSLKEWLSGDEQSRLAKERSDSIRHAEWRDLQQLEKELKTCKDWLV